MSLFKRATGKGKKRRAVWWYHFWDRGVHIQRSSGHTNKTLARKKEAKHRAALADNRPFDVDDVVPGFKNAMRDYLKDAETGTEYHPRSVIRLKSASVPLIAFFKNRALTSIFSADAKAYVAWRKVQISTRTKTTITNACLNREVSCARLLWGFVNKRRDENALPLLRSPFMTIKKMDEGARQSRTLGFPEERAYLSHCEQPLRDIMELLFETGMRPSEVLSLLRGDIHLDANDGPHLRIREGKTPSARRRVELTKAAADVLKGRLVLMTGAALFPTRKDPNIPLPIIPRRLHRTACEKSGVHFTPYVARHTAATRFAQSKMDTPTLADVLGHANTTTLSRYVHPQQEHRRAAMKQAERHNIAEEIAEYERIAQKSAKTDEEALQKPLQ